MLSTMPKKINDKLPKGVSLDRNWRTREARYYFRAPERPKIRLRETPGTKAFDDEVACARLGVPYVKPGEKPAEKPTLKRELREGTFDWLVAEYKRRVAGKISDLVWGRRSRMLEEISNYQFGKARTGDLPFSDMKRRHVLEIRDEIRKTPGAQNDVIRALSAMFSWAVDNDIRGAVINPASKIKLLRSGDGYHTWTVDEVRRYEAKHPEGSKARLFLHMALFTGLRLSDLAILGRQHMQGGWITIRPGKTSKKKDAVVVELPILSALQATIDGSEIGNMTLLTTEFGKPFTVNGLGNKMRDWCDAAELFHCTTHGLRKAGATIAAENGATDEELMAIFGWTTKSQTTTYTKKARRKKIAAGAIHKLVPNSD
jgi:integrase